MLGTCRDMLARVDNVDDVDNVDNVDGVDGWGPAMPWTALWAKDACDGPASALPRSVHLRCTSSSCVSSSDGLVPRVIVSLPVQRQVVGLTVLSSRFT